MLQSVSEWCYFKPHYNPTEYYRRLKAIGYQGVEMVDPARWPLARAAGLDILNLIAPGMEKGLNRLENHASLIPEIRKSIATAAANKIPHVVIFSGNRGSLTDDEGVRNCITGIKQFVGDAEQAGVILDFEVLNSYDHKDYQADHSRFAFEIVKSIGSSNLKCLYDIYHMERMGEKSADVIVKNLPLISHLHIAGSPKRDFPGPEQSIDYKPIVTKVLAAGYTGYWGHEYLPVGDSLEEVERSFKLFESFVKKKRKGYQL